MPSLQLEPDTTVGLSRRTVVRAGAKLAYASPLVAASFKLSPLTALAAPDDAVSGAMAPPVVKAVASKARGTVEIRGFQLSGAEVRFRTDKGALVRSSLDGGIVDNTNTLIVTVVPGGTRISATMVGTLHGRVTFTHDPITVKSAEDYRLTLSAARGEPGDEVEVAGEGFKPGKIEILWDGDPIGTGKAGERGSFRLKVGVPKQAEAGEHLLSARDTDGGVAGAPFVARVADQAPSAELRLSATAGRTGDEISVDGKGFAPGKVELLWDQDALASGMIDDEGAFQLTVAVPEGTRPGEHVLSAQDSTGRSADATFRVEETPDVETKPALDLTSGTGKPGTKVEVVGSGFQPGTVKLLWDGKPLRTGEAGDKGGFRLTVVVPADAATGEHMIGARDAAENAAEASFRVSGAPGAKPTPTPTSTPTPNDGKPDAAELELSKDGGKAGAEVVVTGSGFAPGRIEILWDGDPIKAGKAGDKGEFRLTIAVPKQAEAGEHTLSAQDAAGGAVSVRFRVAEEPTVKPVPAPVPEAGVPREAEITLSADRGKPGAKVDVAGSGFAPGKVEVLWDGDRIETGIVGDKGGFRLSFVVPKQASVGEHNVAARDSAGATTSAPFVVGGSGEGAGQEPKPEQTPVALARPEAKLALSKGSGAPGDEMRVDGSGFPPGEVKILWDGEPVASARAGEQGNFLLTLAVPEDAEPGQHSVSARGAAERTASASFRVVAPDVIEPEPKDGRDGPEQGEPREERANADGGGNQGDAEKQAEAEAEAEARALLRATATIKLSERSGEPGDQVTIDGSGFVPGKIEIAWDGDTIASATANGKGAFRTKVRVPQRAKAGRHALEAKDTGGKRAEAEFSLRS